MPLRQFEASAKTLAKARGVFSRAFVTPCPRSSSIAPHRRAASSPSVSSRRRAQPAPSGRARRRLRPALRSSCARQQRTCASPRPQQRSAGSQMQTVSCSRKGKAQRAGPPLRRMHRKAEGPRGGGWLGAQSALPETRREPAQRPSPANAPAGANRWREEEGTARDAADGCARRGAPGAAAAVAVTQVRAVDLAVVQVAERADEARRAARGRARHHGARADATRKPPDSPPVAAD
jgi:hypothetical protein